MGYKTPEEIDLMREGGKRLARILRELSSEVKPGVRQKQISKIAAEKIQKNDLTAVLLGYEGFSDVMCISVNDAVVHGLPNKQVFKDGDVVKLDLTVGYKGMIVDAATTVYVGSSKPSADIQRLISGTKKSLDLAISAIKGDGTRVGDIAAAAQKVLDQNKLGIVRDLVGHGVGHSIHEAPNVPNYGTAGTGPVLHAGDTIAIEPMASLGDWRIKVGKDRWTISMVDGSISAHFEHTVLITDKGCEILTLE